MPFLLSAKISLIYRNYIRTMEKYSFTNKQKYNTCDTVNLTILQMLDLKVFKILS